MATATVTLERDGKKNEYSQEHAQNILNHLINSTVAKKERYKLPSDSKWTFKEGKLEKK